ncbi:MAG: hypothetical protein ACYCS7_10085 [Acidimicrobiales bacterium]
MTTKTKTTIEEAARHAAQLAELGWSVIEGAIEPDLVWHGGGAPARPAQREEGHQADLGLRAITGIDTRSRSWPETLVSSLAVLSAGRR